MKAMYAWEKPILCGQLEVVEVIRAFSSHYAKCILDDTVANKHQRQHVILSKTVENNTPCYSNIYKIIFGKLIPSQTYHFLYFFFLITSTLSLWQTKSFLLSLSLSSLCCCVRHQCWVKMTLLLREVEANLM